MNRSNEIKPNIIYFICHDLGKHLGCYGAKVKSPNLDGFAKEGIRFDNAFCNAPACSPSRGCAMTGMYSHNNGLMGLVNLGWSMPQSTPTIVDHLNDAGYETVQIGFQHERYKASVSRYKIYGNGTFEENYAEIAVDNAIRYLEEKKDDGTPFYLNIGTWEVHSTAWQGNFIKERAAVYQDGVEDEAYMPNYIPDVLALRKEMLKFQACIRYLDRQIQRLFDAINNMGYAENTIVIFTTDHGIGNVRAKGTLYDRGVEIALMMHMPGMKGRGRIINELIQNIDIVPTLLDAAGIDIPSYIDGRSFWGLINDGEYEPHEEIFIERNHHGDFDPMRALRTKHYHYIRNFDKNAKKEWLPHEVPYMNETYKTWCVELWPKPELQRDEQELFDVVNDPDEFINLAYSEDHKNILDELSVKLDEWMIRTSDPLLGGAIPDKLHPWPKEAEK